MMDEDRKKTDNRIKTPQEFYLRKKETSPEKYPADFYRPNKGEKFVSIISQGFYRVKRSEEDEV